MRTPFDPQHIKERSQRLTPKQFSKRLNWRLTGLFVLASVLTAAVVHLLSVGATALYLLESNSTLSEIEAQLAQEEAEASSYFDGPAPDRVGLTRLLYRMMLPDEITTGIQFRALFVTVGTFRAAICYPNGEIITSGPDSKTFPIGADLTQRLNRAELDLVNEARSGITRAVWSDGRIIVAAPIKNKGVLRGIAFGRSDVLDQGWRTWGPVLNEIYESLFVTLFVTLFVGSMIGSMFARRTTRRLISISNVSDRWASGDLSALAPEKPEDELGLLAGRLNQMAAELQQVIRLRNEVATLEERQRITRDLHDTVKQEAFATAMMVGSAQQYLASDDRDNTQKALAEAFELARRMQINLSTILAELRSGESALSLTDRIELITQDWNGRNGMQVVSMTSFDGEGIDDQAADHLARISEEAIANAVKHSNGTRVSVSLASEGETLTLIIEDDGKGFGSRARSKGLGLSTMTERAQLLPGGQLTVDSKPGQGTRIIVQCGIATPENTKTL